MRKHMLWCLALMMSTACSDNKTENMEKEGVETVLPQQVNEVTVMKLTKGYFNHELVSNGKIVAKDYADLYFRTSEVVAKVYVRNGTFVRKGQKLAELDMFKLNNTLRQNENALAQANLEMQDVLIGQGYAPDNLNAVPADVLELAKVKSGYKLAKAQYEASLYDVEQATLTAPFDGVVANLFDKQYNIPKNDKPFCRVIRTSAMEVDFTVLENELPLIKVYDQVEVTPYASAVGTRTGSISVKRSVPNQIVVPKTAIVLRSGKQVMFTVKDNIAMWNYVTTGLENLTEYTLTNWEASGLQEGMRVITTGNVNLAHETPVKIIE